jgi:hypothetical protein
MPRLAEDVDRLGREIDTHRKSTKDYDEKFKGYDKHHDEATKKLTGLTTDLAGVKAVSFPFQENLQ